MKKMIVISFSNWCEKVTKKYIYDRIYFCLFGKKFITIFARRIRVEYYKEYIYKRYPKDIADYILFVRGVK